MFEHFGMEMEDLAPWTYLLHPANANRETIPSLPDEGTSVIFDRKRALSREDVGYISCDHPIVTGAIDIVLSSSTGLASVTVFKGTSDPGIYLEVIFVSETAEKKGINVDRFLPTTPLRIMVNHLGKEITDNYPAYLMNKQFIPGHIDDLIENEWLLETIIINMIHTDGELTEQRKMEKVKTGLTLMSQTLNHEIGRLAALHKLNNSKRLDEVRTALEEKELLTNLISEACIRMDSLQLIRVGGM